MAGKFERPRKKKRGGGAVTLAALLLVCAGAFGIRMLSEKWAVSEAESTAPVQLDSVQTQAPATEAVTEPAPVVKESTATIGATGDILLHDLVIQSGYDSETDTYHYDNIFKWFSAYVSQVDYAAANLEVTLCGDDNGYAYSGYPCFNSPDEIVDAAKAAGFDLLLTANNHSYDTKFTGFTRTQQVIGERGLDHIGTRLDAEDQNYIIRDINGINIAMTCYTYCSAYTSAGNFKLNGNALSSEASQLVNAFHYKDLDTFYRKLSGELEQMKADGAEAVVLFIHWGDEYQTAPNAIQKQMAQELCNLGIDVIVGNHAHVVQPVELLTSQTDETRKTLCLYSTGNAVSNIYKNNTFPVHTEDGMLFTFTFAKYSDGTVLVESADVLPTWVWRYDDDSGVRKFQILTMDDEADWQEEMGLTDELLVKCQESYDRTMELVGEGLETANGWYAQQQAQTETALGIR